MCAYDESYVIDASKTLGEYFSYMVCDLKHTVDETFEFLAHSRVGRCFGEGNPRYVSGMAGVELARNVIFEICRTWEDKEASVHSEKDEEYRLGCALAMYQWHSGYSFSMLLKRGLSGSKIAEFYSHNEIDIDSFYEDVDKSIGSDKSEANKLKRLRTYSGLTQKGLSDASGVALRMIQLYEQGQNDITKASVETVMRLANALNCRVEELVAG